MNIYHNNFGDYDVMFPPSCSSVQELADVQALLFLKIHLREFPKRITTGREQTMRTCALDYLIINHVATGVNAVYLIRTSTPPDYFKHCITLARLVR